MNRQHIELYAKNERLSLSYSTTFPTQLFWSKKSGVVVGDVLDLVVELVVGLMCGVVGGGEGGG